MRIGAFADSHDHLDHLKLAVAEFNRRECELVLFAGDLVSSFAVPILRDLRCPLLGCFGDNEGNQTGVAAGFKILGAIGWPPFGIDTADGTRIVLTHMLSHLQGDNSDCQIVVYAHTHKPEVRRDPYGRLLVNPGETSGWSYGMPTVAIIETNPLWAEIVSLKSLAVT